MPARTSVLTGKRDKKRRAGRWSVLALGLVLFMSTVVEPGFTGVNEGLSGPVVAQDSSQGNSNAERERAKREIFLRVSIHCSSFPPVDVTARHIVVPS